jgi:hypothetical protein
MTNQTYTVTGTVTDGNTVTLDTAVPLKSAKVRVTLEPMPNPQELSYIEVIEEIHRNQRARGFQPPTKEEVDEYIRQERESW